MGIVDQLVRRTARRLTVQQGLQWLVWGWTAAAFGSAISIVLTRLLGTSPDVTLVAVGSCWLVGTAAALVLAWTYRVSSVRAAAELDRAFFLKDRVTTAVSLPESLRHAPATQVLLKDVTRQLEGLDPSERFPWRWPRALWAPLVFGGLAVVCWFLVPARQAQTEESERDPVPTLAEAKLKQRLRNATEPLKSQLEELEKRGRGDGEELAELRRLLGQLEEAVREAQDARAKPERSLRRISDVETALRRQQEALKRVQRVQQALQEVARRAAEHQQLANDPLARFQNALARGNLKEAAEALQRLAKELRSSQFKHGQLKEMAEQLEQMAQELKKLQELRELRERLAKSGLKGEQLERALKRLQEQLGDPERLQQFAEAMQQVAKLLEDPNLAQLGAGQLEALAQQLQDLAEELQALQLAEDLLDAIADLRQRLACDRCEGKG